MPVTTSLVQVATKPVVVEVGVKLTVTPLQIGVSIMDALDNTGVGFTTTVTVCTLRQLPGVFKV
jgi:hypothetical protein